MKNESIQPRSRQYERTTILFITSLMLVSLCMIPIGTASYNPTEDRASDPTREIGWEKQKSGTTDNLFGVHFTNGQVGTAVGGAWDHDVILHTSNSGELWTRMRDQGPTPAGLLAVSFYDKNIGMAVGYYGTIEYTTNGGTDWLSASTYYMNTYFGCDMFNETIGYAVGVSNIFAPIVTRTRDGWHTSETFSFLIFHDDVYHEADLTDVNFISPLVGFASARVAYGQGAIVRTVDGGENWKTVYYDDARNILGIEFLSEKLGYAVGTQGLIIKTMDGGRHWIQLNSWTSVTLNDLSFSTKEIGTVVGEYGFILRTVNGGRTWVRQNSGIPFSLNAVCFVDTSNGYAVGEQGIILHTSSGGNPPYAPQTPPQEPFSSIVSELHKRLMSHYQ